MGIKPHSFMYLLSMATFTLQWQSYCKRVYDLQSKKYLLSSPFQNKLADYCLTKMKYVWGKLQKCQKDDVWNVRISIIFSETKAEGKGDYREKDHYAEIWKNIKERLY
jgi:hypothetical protein